MKTYLENLRKSTTMQADQIRIQINNVLALAKAHNAVAQSQKSAAEAANKAANEDPRFRGIKITDNSAFNRTVAGNLKDLNSGFPTSDLPIADAKNAQKLKDLNAELNATEAAINNIDKALAELQGGGAKKNPFEGLGGQSGLNLGNTDTKKSSSAAAVKVQEDPRKKAFEEEMARIAYQAEMYDWSASKQIAALENVRTKHKAYLKGSVDDERSILLQIRSLHEQVYEEAYQASVRWIDERKYYNQLSLEEELAAWKRMSVRYKAGSEERIQIDREIYRVQQEIHQQRIDAIEKESEAAQEAARRQLDDINAALDAQSAAVGDAAAARIANLRGQIQQVNDELERQLKIYDDQLKALDRLVEQEDRAKEADKFAERVKALQDQMTWYQEQGAEKFAFEIAGLNRQLRDEQAAWAERMRQWEIDDKKDAIQEAIDDARDIADGKIDNLNSQIEAAERERQAALARIEQEKARANQAFEDSQRLIETIMQQQVAAQQAPTVGKTLSSQSRIQATANSGNTQMAKSITDAIKQTALKSITVLSQIDSEIVAQKTIPIIGNGLSQPIRSL
jgi:hypothetical protein